MATLSLTNPPHPPSPPVTPTNLKQKQPKNQSHFPLSTVLPRPISTHHHYHHRSSYRSSSPPTTTICSYKVVIEHEGESTELDVDPDENILERALDSGISVPHDCKLGVCMTCPAKLVSGTVDQSEGMLSDDVIEKGYALLCASKPRSDCVIRTIPEEELLSMQLATAND